MSIAAICDNCGKVGPATSILSINEVYNLVQDWYLSGNDYCPDCIEVGMKKEQELYEEDYIQDKLSYA